MNNQSFFRLETKRRTGLLCERAHLQGADEVYQAEGSEPVDNDSHTWNCQFLVIDCPKSLDMFGSWILQGKKTLSYWKSESTSSEYWIALISVVKRQRRDISHNIGSLSG